VAVARRLGAARVVAAVPVGSSEAVGALRREADEVICPLVPSGFGAVSRYYRTFPQTTDDEVIELLEQAHRELA
jgi:predicted phosphoribosyltransferase